MAHSVFKYSPTLQTRPYVLPQPHFRAAIMSHSATYARPHYATDLLPVLIERLMRLSSRAPPTSLLLSHVAEPSRLLHATAATTLGRRRVTASAHASPHHVTVDARDAVLLLVTMSAVMTTRRPSSFNARMMPLLLALSAVIFAVGAALKLGKPDDRPGSL